MMQIETDIEYKILWVENDFFHIQSLLYWIKKDAKYTLESVTSLYDATQLLEEKPSDYFDLIILDFIMGGNDEKGRAPAWFSKDERLGANGVLLLKHARNVLEIKCPILILSIMENPIEYYNLNAYGHLHCLAKRGLRPSNVKKIVNEILLGKE